MNRDLPTFIGVGVAKSGTSFVAQLLGDHPQIFMHPDKEPGFYAPTPRVSEESEYRETFRAAPERIKGEFSTTYCNSTETLRRIRTAIPDVKIIVGFRNPVEALWSAYNHYLRGGHKISYAEFVPWYVGEYPGVFDYDRILNDLQMFDKVEMYLYDDLSRDPGSVAHKLYAFLGADPHYRPASLGYTVNHGYQYRSRRLFLATVEGLNWLYGGARGKLMAINPYERTRLARWLYELNETKREMPESMRSIAAEATAPRCKSFVVRFPEAQSWFGRCPV